MNLSTGPPNENGAWAGTALRNLRLWAEYRLIATLQWPFEIVFWKLEQKKARLADQLANEGDS